MDRQSDETRYVRRVVLPSGKTIEVVYSSELTQAERETAATGGRASREMHVCPQCDSELVYPVEWQEADETRWHVTLRCPNCEWWMTGTFNQEVVERFDEELDRGTEALVRDLKRLMHANLEDEIDRFVAALEAGHIVADDF